MALDTNAVAPKIRDYISRNFLFSAQGFHYGDDASFLEEGIIDSLGIIELVSFVEKEFGISVADHELLPDNFDSVSKLSSFIIGKMGNGS
jgi:acyl carrier protein